MWTLLVSKGVQQVIKRLIRLLARRTAEEHAQSGWLEVLHLQWRAMQSLAIGFMWLCVMLFLLEGERRAHRRGALSFSRPPIVPVRRPLLDQADVQLARADGLLVRGRRRWRRVPPLQLVLRVQDALRQAGDVTTRNRVPGFVPPFFLAFVLCV